MEAAQGFGLAFRVDDQTNKIYQGYGINIEDASGETHHLLPVPAAYLVDSKGKIQFEYHNADHKIRIDPAALLSAAKKTVGK